MLIGLGFGCQAGLPAAQLREVRDAVAGARDSGAYHCAPKELALAQAHIEFAQTEAVHGASARGEFHLREAKLNAQAARELSMGAGCDKRRVSHRSDSGKGPSEDRDGDGVIDDVDLCPDQAEDHDGYLDEDGCFDPPSASADDLDGTSECSETDNRGNGHRGATDCPGIRGGMSARGPDAICATSGDRQPTAACEAGRYMGIELRDNALVLADGVRFEGRTTTFDEGSQLRLQALARWLLERPTLTLEIQGHVDSRGDAKENVRLSSARAEVVRALLIEHGIAAARLTARGYGETRPLESNRTSQGRALNRRIEFVRTDTAK